MLMEHDRRFYCVYAHKKKFNLAHGISYFGNICRTDHAVEEIM